MGALAAAPATDPSRPSVKPKRFQLARLDGRVNLRPDDHILTPRRRTIVIVDYDPAIGRKPGTVEINRALDVAIGVDDEQVDRAGRKPLVHRRNDAFVA